MNYSIREIEFKKFRNEILALRKEVWESKDYLHALQIFKEGFEDSLEDSAIHWVIQFDGQLIASARLSVHFEIESIPDYALLEFPNSLRIKYPLASFNRLVVSKEFQKNGISDLLDEVRASKAKHLKCKSICVMTYGNRGRKLIADGFTEFPILTITKNIQSSLQILNPPAFYYKEI